MSIALSNYLGDSVSRLASTFTLERYNSRILAQHVNDAENVMVTFVGTWVWMHLNDIGLPQFIVFSIYDVSSREISFRWSVQVLNESPFFDTDDVFIGSHVSYTIIDWLMYNNARDEITLRNLFNFLNVTYCTFCRLPSFVLFFIVF